MLAFSQTTTSISSDFFTGSLWETKRSDDLSEALSLLLQPKADQCFPSFLELLVILQLNTFPHFPKNARENVKPLIPPKHTPTSLFPRTKVKVNLAIVFTISVWCWARVLWGSGRLITNTVNCSKLEWVGDTFASSHNKAVFTLPRV